MNEPTNFGTNELKPHNWPDKDIPYWSLKCNLTADKNQWDEPPYKPSKFACSILHKRGTCLLYRQV